MGLTAQGGDNGRREEFYMLINERDVLLCNSLDYYESQHNCYVSAVRRVGKQVSPTVNAGKRGLFG